jgi:hypothetical protein
MRLPGSHAICVYDLASERAVASRGARGMRSRQEGHLVRWALDSARAATRRTSGGGDVTEVSVARDGRLHTLAVLRPSGAEGALVHLVSDLAVAEPRAIREALQRIRTETRRDDLLGARREPGGTWPRGAPPAFARAQEAKPGNGVRRPVPDRDPVLLDRVLASLRNR